MRNGRSEHVVARALVVVREGPPVVADRHDAAVVVRPPRIVDQRRPGPRELAVGRVQGVARQDVLDVHDQQLLVLLLVVQTELQQLAGPRRDVPVEQLADRDVDVLTVRTDLGDARSCDQPARDPRVPGSDGLVVRVEQEAEVVVVGRVVRAEHEGLEEPRRVGPVPLRRADVGHRLHRLVLCAQRRGQALGERPHRAVVAHAITAGPARRRSHRLDPSTTGAGAARRRAARGAHRGDGTWR